MRVASAGRRIGRRALLAAAALSLPAALARRTIALAGLGGVTVRRVTFDSALGHNIADLTVNLDGVAYAASLLTYYTASGGLRRWGHAVSEPLIENGALVQYFQRGVMVWSGDAPDVKPVPRLAWDFIGGGLDGSLDLGVDSRVSLDPPAQRSNIADPLYCIKGSPDRLDRGVTCSLPMVGRPPDPQNGS